MVSPAPASIQQRIFGGFEEEHSLAHELPAVVTDAIHLPREPFSWVLQHRVKNSWLTSFLGSVNQWLANPLALGLLPCWE